MTGKEANARKKIDKLLEIAGWRFEDSDNGKANIRLESKVKKEDLGDDFQNIKNGYIDYLLLDNNQKPLVVLEAKRESLDPLIGKEQARNYANSINVIYVILSNGVIHYFWNIKSGNPEQIQSFPTLESLNKNEDFSPDVNKLIKEKVEEDYIVLTQVSDYKTNPDYLNNKENFIFNNNLKFLRDYQIKAIKSVQKAIKKGNKRFLLEMATGTGKTLTAAAIIKLFHRTGNVRRVLFLVDRVELEKQTEKNFIKYLNNDMIIKKYKENKDDWQMADVVISTIQSLLVNNKYKYIFSPLDFDLVISDEAHRMIGGGSSRGLFEYFLGYKLGLTATPKDYLKNIKKNNIDDQRELERRVLLDTYKTFGCENSNPTFRYTLIEGAKDGILLQPYVIDARTEITTQLLSDEGYSRVINNYPNENEDDLDTVSFNQKDFEKKFFSNVTNDLFCKNFIEKGLKDPINGEFGKGLVFAVSQKHASKLTQILNEIADKKYPGKYQSNFAVQVTSNVKDSQQMTSDFSEDKLLGFSNFANENEILEYYKTSKARVCVTVGMMTTGWDCPNILNIALMRPIFSPTEFIQIKGRGTRIHKFENKYKNNLGKYETKIVNKVKFILFDFFGNYEYFEKKFKYDEVLNLPNEINKNNVPIINLYTNDAEKSIYEYKGEDEISILSEKQIDEYGMKIDRMFFKQFEEKIKDDKEIDQLMKAGEIENAVSKIKEKYENKPEEYFNLEKLGKALEIDRKIGWREVLDLVYNKFEIKKKYDLLDDEFEKFINTEKITNIEDIQGLKYFFESYITQPNIRTIIDNNDIGSLFSNSVFSKEDYDKVNEKMREKTITYIKNYIQLNKFIAA